LRAALPMEALTMRVVEHPVPLAISRSSLSPMTCPLQNG
jgi:hypothetical protein